MLYRELSTGESAMLIVDLNYKKVHMNMKIMQNYYFSNKEWLKEMFLECYPLQLQSPTPSEHEQWLEMKQACLENYEALLPWACWEAAQLCVLNKLRTPLGKPPETFTAIELALRELARQTKMSDVSSDRDFNAIYDFKRARTLLEFMEYLEKVRGPDTFIFVVEHF